MKYAIVGIEAKDAGKFEVTFSNGQDVEKINVASLSNETWCLFNHSGKPIKFYSSIEELVQDFEKELNQL